MTQAVKEIFLNTTLCDDCFYVAEDSSDACRAITCCIYFKSK